MPSQHLDKATIESDPFGGFHSSQTCHSHADQFFSHAHLYGTFVWMLFCTHHKNQCPHC